MSWVDYIPRIPAPDEITKLAGLKTEKEKRNFEIVVTVVAFVVPGIFWFMNLVKNNT